MAQISNPPIYQTGFIVLYIGGDFPDTSFIESGNTLSELNVRRFPNALH